MLIKLPKIKVPELEIIIQEDAEGNGYHTAWAWSIAIDDPNNSYPGENTNLEEYYPDGNVPKKRVLIIV